MIESVHLRDLGVIVDAEIACGAGLTVITGETGAGKTMLLTGLGLLWGERADPSRVRQGSDQARVDGVLRISDPLLRGHLQQILDDVGGQWDDDAIIISRTVHAEGRSRAHLGGRMVPAGVLADVANLVVAVHGQDDQMRLRSGRHQRSALDSFAGDEFATVLGDYQGIYDDLKAAIHARTVITENAQSRQREADDLRAALTLIDDVQPQVGESVALREEADRLSHGDRIADALQSALSAMRDESNQVGASQDRSVAESIAQARAFLASVADHDRQIAALMVRLDEVAALVGEAVVDLAGLVSSTDIDPARLDFIENRRSHLATLRRRVGLIAGMDDPDEEAILGWAHNARLRLVELDNDPTELVELDQRIESLRAAVGSAASRISSLREEAAEQLAQRVTEELASLAMPRSRLIVRVSHRAPGEGLVVPIDSAMASADRTGVDDVSFELAGHEDDEPRPLVKGASGGERSRIMLALEVVLARGKPVPTMVFDEVDAGVGGRAAIEVGRRLARLARRTQVLVVTHLPQVAAFADTHLVVRADPQGQVTQATVEVVDGQSRRRELARMLAGMEDSTTAVAHAEELLELAQRERHEGAPTLTQEGRSDTPVKGRRGPRGR
jgi:DNA repair protein RecN (Recombination protein N)